MNWRNNLSHFIGMVLTYYKWVYNVIMKVHVKLYGTNYCLCGLHISKMKPMLRTEVQDVCMQCGYVASGLLGLQNDVREYHKAIRKLKARQ